MKIQSEFYLDELIYIMRGATLCLNENAENIKRLNRRHTIMTILQFWKRKQLNDELYNHALRSLAVTEMLKGIAEKVMEAQGRDEDGEFVTMEQMMNLMQED